MATTNAASGLTVQQWDERFFKEYFQESPFARYMGTNENSIIQVKEDLTRKPGATITYALANRLTNAAIVNNATLEGNEEDLVTRSHTVTVNLRRNGVVVPKYEGKKSAIPLREAARSALQDWAQEDQRDLIIEAGHSINGTAYASASEANKDAWLVDNADRVLFGAAKSNNSSNDHSASLANVDNTNDQLDTAAISLMKRMALTATPKIKPIRMAGMNKRFFVLFVHPLVMRDLKSDSVITNAQRDVVLRNQNNKLFEGGDVEWDGVIVHELDDMSILSGVGASSIDVSPTYFCGAQSFGFAWAQRWQSIVDETGDYRAKPGVAIEAMYDVDKLTFGSGSGDTDDLQDHGMLTGYFASVADS